MMVAVGAQHLFLLASLSLLASVLCSKWRLHGRIASWAALLLAVLAVMSGLLLAAIRRGGWPLAVTAELPAGAAAVGMLWALAAENKSEGTEALGSHAANAGLLVWTTVRWPVIQAPAMVEPAQQVWLFTSHLTLAIASATFLRAGSTTLAHYIQERRERQDAAPRWVEEGAQPLPLAGLPLLVASVWLTAVGNQYTRGTAWDWSALESWQLVLLCLYLGL